MNNRKKRKNTGNTGGRRVRRNTADVQKKRIVFLSVLVLIAAVFAVIAACFAIKVSKNKKDVFVENDVTEQTTEEVTTKKSKTKDKKEASTESTTSALSDRLVSGAAITISAEENAKIDKILSSMTLEEKINQMFIITPEALTGVGVVTASGDATRSALKNHPVGGLIYFGQNIESESQVKSMISDVKSIANDVCKVPLFVCIDEEGGTVARLGNSGVLNVPSVASMSALGASGDTEQAYNAGKTIGKYLSDYGFNLDFAPVADVITNPLNTVVKDRSFGTNPDLVSQMAVRVSNGLNSQGVYSCYKHFPGHGATTDDSHEGFAYTDKSYDELAQNELKPFVSAINNNADFIMVGHISVPGVTGDNTPASVSSVVINDILKGRLGYKGIVITDSLAMGAISNYYSPSEISVQAVESGVDVLLMPADFNAAYNGLLSAVQSGRISEDRINESVRKIIYRKLKL